MPRKLPPGGRHFQYRNGLLQPGGGGERFFWKGMATKVDLGAQPADHPRLVVNGRYTGGHIVARPPMKDAIVKVPLQTVYIGDPSYWDPKYIRQHGPYGGLKLWWGGGIPTDTGLDPNPDTGGTCGFIDTDWDPEFNEVSIYPMSTNFVPHVERFFGHVYVGGYGALRRLYRLTPDPGTWPSSLTEALTDEVVVAFPGYRVDALRGHEGKLYYLLVDTAGAADARIFSWDGFSNVLEYTVTGIVGNQGCSMMDFNSTLVVAIKGSANIFVRATSGAWSTATVAGFTASPRYNAMARVKSKLYIAGGVDKLYSWDGTTLAAAHTLATFGTGTSKALNCCAEFNGRLYYMWYEDLPGDANWPWLGVFDPDTVNASYKWHDDYKAIAASVPDFQAAFTDAHTVDGDHPYIATYGDPLSMVVYRQRLYCAIKYYNAACTFIPGYSMLFTHTVENNPYSEWYVTHPCGRNVTPTGPLYYLTNGQMRTLDYMKVF